MDNLTTTITDMQEYIAANPTFRKHPVDFPEYKKWVEVYDAIKPREVPTRKSAKAANQKNKGKSKALPTGPSDANPEDLDVEDDNGDPDGDRDGDYGKDGRNARGHRSPGMKLLNALGITKEDFLNRMSDVRNFMKKSFPFALPHRSSDLFVERIVTTGGLTWNGTASNHKRDFAPIAICAILEVAIVQTYRSKLLNTKACRGACVLRGILADSLTGKSTSAIRYNPTKNKTEMCGHWAFTDLLTVTVELDGLSEVIDVDAIANAPGSQPAPPSAPLRLLDGYQPPAASLAQPKIKPKAYDATSMSQVRQASHAMNGKSGARKEKKPMVTELVDYLEKNRFLHCSHSKAPPGTVETLASFAISVLAKVRRPFHPTFTPRLADRHPAFRRPNPFLPPSPSPVALLSFSIDRGF